MQIEQKDIIEQLSAKSRELRDLVRGGLVRRENLEVVMNTLDRLYVLLRNINYLISARLYKPNDTLTGIVDNIKQTVKEIANQEELKIKSRKVLFETEEYEKERSKYLLKSLIRLNIFRRLPPLRKQAETISIPPPDTMKQRLIADRFLEKATEIAGDSLPPELEDYIETAAMYKGGISLILDDMVEIGGSVLIRYFSQPLHDELQRDASKYERVKEELKLAIDDFQKVEIPAWWNELEFYEDPSLGVETVAPKVREFAETILRKINDRLINVLRGEFGISLPANEDYRLGPAAIPFIELLCWIRSLHDFISWCVDACDDALQKESEEIFTIAEEAKHIIQAYGNKIYNHARLLDSDLIKSKINELMNEIYGLESMFAAIGEYQSTGLEEYSLSQLSEYRLEFRDKFKEVLREERFYGELNGDAIGRALSPAFRAIFAPKDQLNEILSDLNNPMGDNIFFKIEFKQPPKLSVALSEKITESINTGDMQSIHRIADSIRRALESFYNTNSWKLVWESGETKAQVKNLVEHIQYWLGGSIKDSPWANLASRVKEMAPHIINAAKEAVMEAAGELINLKNLEVLQGIVSLEDLNDPQADSDLKLNRLFLSFTSKIEEIHESVGRFPPSMQIPANIAKKIFWGGLVDSGSTLQYLLVSKAWKPFAIKLANIIAKYADKPTDINLLVNALASEGTIPEIKEFLWRLLDMGVWNAARDIVRNAVNKELGLKDKWLSKALICYLTIRPSEKIYMGTIHGLDDDSCWWGRLEDGIYTFLGGTNVAAGYLFDPEVVAEHLGMPTYDVDELVNSLNGMRWAQTWDALIEKAIGRFFLYIKDGRIEFSDGNLRLKGGETTARANAIKNAVLNKVNSLLRAAKISISSNHNTQWVELKPTV